MCLGLKFDVEIQAGVVEKNSLTISPLGRIETIYICDVVALF